MASNINPLYPEAGSATTQSVRDNFAAAQAEIEALQSGKEDAGTAAAEVAAHETSFDHDLLALIAPASVPASPSATGTPGQWAWGSPYLYWCVETDTWVRVVPARSWT